MWPKIKKKIGDFLSDESGFVSKKSVISLGIISLSFSIFVPEAESKNHYPRTEEFEITPNINDFPDCPHGDEDYSRDIYGSIKVVQNTDGTNSHHGRIYFNIDGANYKLTEPNCVHSGWLSDPFLPWVIPDETSCDLDSNDESGDSARGGEERFIADIIFDDMFEHENSIKLDSSDNSMFLAIHDHSITTYDECNFKIDLWMDTGRVINRDFGRGDECYRCMESVLRYRAFDSSGHIYKEFEEFYDGTGDRYSPSDCDNACH